MSGKRVIKYVSLWDSCCGLSTDTKAQILRRNGTVNVKVIRNATKSDVELVRSMGGYVPEGRISAEKTQ